MLKRPAIGTKMYSVWEHFYHVQGCASPRIEYCVCEGTVTGFYEGGYIEIRLLGPNPDGYMTPYYHRLGDIGKRIFFTPYEAAQYAKKTTESYENGFWGQFEKEPLRRPWEHLLRI